MKRKLSCVSVLIVISTFITYVHGAFRLQKGDSVCVQLHLLYNESAYENLKEEWMFIADCYPKSDFVVVRDIQDSIINMRVFRNEGGQYYLYGIFNVIKHTSLSNTLLFQGKQVFFHPLSPKVKEVRFYNNQHLLVQAEQMDEDGNVRQKMSRSVTDFYSYRKYDAAKQLIEECRCKEDTSNCEKTIYLNPLNLPLREDVQLPMTRRGTMREVGGFSIAELVDEDRAADDELYIIVDAMPEFPGGQQALMNYLGANVRYPEAAQEKGIQGRVICQFVINKDGSIVDVRVVSSGGDPSLDKEALRVVKNMPNFIPGKLHGKPVRVRYTLPINFRLE